MEIGRCLKELTMKIVELTLPTTNIDRQQTVFSEILGFPCNRQSESQLSIECGATSLNFTASDRQFYYHYCFLIPPGCIESAIEFLDKRLFEPLPYNEERIVEFGSGRAVYFFDGDGNLAEFIERPSLGHPTQSSFDIRDVIRLNEIGVPSENPKELANELISKYGIDLVGDGVLRDDFVWCGDYEGVFVIPKIGRNWLPCDKPAEPNDLDVVFETNSGQFNYQVRVEASQQPE